MKNHATRMTRRDWAIAGGSTAAVAVIGTQGRAAEFEWKCASNEPIDHPVSVRMIQMWKAVENESKGRLKVTYFPNSVLGGDPAMVSQLRLGALQFFTMNPGNLASVVPAADVEYVGWSIANADEGMRVMNGPVGKFLENEIAAKGMYSLPGVWDAGILSIGSSTHPIRNPDDFHGLKIRVPLGRVTIDLFKELGASPTQVSQADVYTALQTKLIDAQGSSIAVIAISHWYEVEKSVSLTYHQWSAIRLVANGDAWKSLPGDLKDIVQRNNLKYTALGHRDMSLLDESLVDKLARLGIAINKPEPAQFRARLHTYYDNWAKNLGPTLWGLLESSLGRKLTS